jgi:putative ABC transport system ATP-binding protein
MGFIFQNFNLLGSFTALENVLVPMSLAGAPDRKRARELLALVGLGDRLRHYPSQLSGGQQQRVAIARAMANDPLLIIGDEPTGDLDTETAYDVMGLLVRLSQERGTTIIYVTHDSRMTRFATCLHAMRDGRLDEDQTRTQ